jgi:hypothetical protein
MPRAVEFFPASEPDGRAAAAAAAVGLALANILRVASRRVSPYRRVVRLCAAAKMLLDFIRKKPAKSAVSLMPEPIHRGVV